jgi:hypothetical protein
MLSQRTTGIAHMIDSKAIAQELQHARQARIEAEAEYCDIEEMLWDMNHPHPAGGRVAYAFDGFGRQLADWSN